MQDLILLAQTVLSKFKFEVMSLFLTIDQKSGPTRQI